MAGLGDNFKKANEEAKKINEELVYILDAIQSIGANLNNAFSDAVDKAVELEKVSESLGDILKRGYSKDLKDIAKISEDLIKANAKQQAGILKYSELQRLQNKLLEAKAIKEARFNQAKINGIELSEEETKELEKQTQEIEKQLALLNKKARSRGFFLDAFDELFGDKLKKFNEKDLGILVLQQMGKAIKSADTNVADFGKAFGITRGEALRFNTEIAKSSLKARTLGVNLNSVKEAIFEVNKALGGTAFAFEEDLRNDVAFLQKRLGLSAEEAANLAIESLSSGRAIRDEIVPNTEKVIRNIKTSTGVALSFRDVLQDAAKVSGALRLTLEALPDGVVNATAKAKALGTELGTIRQIQKDFLDIESSITKQIQAQVLTGKELNLEQARYYALTNNIDGLIGEIEKNLGSIEEFQRMNVFQQDALAQAIGLTDDMYAEILRKNESINNSLETAVETQGESIAKNASMLSVQDQLVESLNALNTTLQTLTGFLGAAALAAALLNPFGAAFGLAARIGVGALGVGAIGTAGAGIIPTGDLRIDPNGGPIVASPQQGAIYQGKRNDALAMGPGGGNNQEVVSAIKQLGSDMKNMKLQLAMDSRNLNDAMMTSGVSYLS
jgi:hypothetical protein